MSETAPRWVLTLQFTTASCQPRRGHVHTGALRAVSRLDTAAFSVYLDSGTLPLTVLHFTAAPAWPREAIFLIFLSFTSEEIDLRKWDSLIYHLGIIRRVEC